MIGATRLVNRLKYHGIQHVFGYPGGAILEVLNQFHGQKDIQYILSRTEAGGSFMAEGYAKATKKPGVVMVTSGPGAINVMTSLQNALSDGTPLLALTGQVSTAVLGTDAFQEADIIGISKPCTKWNRIIMNQSKIESSVDEAFFHMKHQRNGSVLLDLPKNVMSSETSEQEVFQKPECNDVKESTISIEEIMSLIRNSRRPVILAGQGVLQSDSWIEVRELAFMYKIPVTTTLMGLGIVNERNQDSLKMLGMHGSFAANMAIQNSDLLLNFGSRFDDRIIGKPSTFAPQATIVHIDVLPKNINKTIRTHYFRNECVRKTLDALVDKEEVLDSSMTNAWWKQIETWKKTQFSYPKNASVLQGRHVLATLNQYIQKDIKNNYTIVSDVGAHQMWAAQFIDYCYPRIKFITSGGLGTMGFALPASIGVKLGSPERQVICICGDGGFTMTFQEILTAVEQNIPIKVIILNNSYQLMVKIWQEKFYSNNLIGTKMNNPSFELVVKSLGCEALRVESESDVELAFDHFLNYKGPIVMNVITDSSESVLPMVAPGKALDDMILDETVVMKGDAPC